MPRISVLISVVAYGHHVAWWQWVGVFCVYGGLALNVRARYAAARARSLETRERDRGGGDGDEARGFLTPPPAAEKESEMQSFLGSPGGRRIERTTR